MTAEVEFCGDCVGRSHRPEQTHTAGIESPHSPPLGRVEIFNCPDQREQKAIRYSTGTLLLSQSLDIDQVLTRGHFYPLLLIPAGKIPADKLSWQCCMGSHQSTCLVSKVDDAIVQQIICCWCSTVQVRRLCPPQLVVALALLLCFPISIVNGLTPYALVVSTMKYVDSVLSFDLGLLQRE